jgi:hypothetical protein
MAIIYSTGFQQSITNDGLNSKPAMNIIEWDADYKNNQGKMNVKINKNGKKNKYQVKLNKNDLEKILKMPVVNQSLDQRLSHDFPILHLDNEFIQEPAKNNRTSKTRKNMKNIPKPKKIATRMVKNNNNQYDELEDLFALRKKLMSPYHLTHTKKNMRKKIKSRKNNKAKGFDFLNSIF